MSEKDVKDNETEALNNAAAENAENADIEAGETDMALVCVWTGLCDMTMEAIPSQPNRQKTRKIRKASPRKTALPATTRIA